MAVGKKHARATNGRGTPRAARLLRDTLMTLYMLALLGVFASYCWVVLGPPTTDYLEWERRFIESEMAYP